MRAIDARYRVAFRAIVVELLWHDKHVLSNATVPASPPVGRLSPRTAGVSEITYIYLQQQF